MASSNLRIVLVAAVALFACTRAAAQQPRRYAAGDIVQNFTLTDRATGQPVSLYDLEGKIVFLEWFSWWCPFCQAAANQVGPGIVEYYAQLGGNPNGVPIVHVSLNLQGGQEAQAQDFIDTYGLGLVLNDFDRAVANRFQTGGQPIFAIINGVDGSPSHDQWELVYSRLGYGELQTPITIFRTHINSVQAGFSAPPVPTVVTQHPLSQTVQPGSSVMFESHATGDGVLAFKWKRDGVVIPGATAATLEINNVQTTDAGYYTVEATGGEGTTTSRFARLVVAPPAPGIIASLSVRALASVGGQPLIVGFNVNDGAKEVLIRGVGPTLVDFFVDGAIEDTIMTVFNGPTAVETNDDWAESNEAQLTATFTTLGAFPLPPESLDSAIVGSYGGARTIHINSKNGQPGVALVELYDAGSGLSPKLSSISARNEVGTGDNILIVGFTVSGNMPKQLLIRGVGPGLTRLDVPDVLADPVLEVHTKINDQDVIVATNDNWSDEPNAAQAAAVPGTFELTPGSNDAVLLLTLPAGIYTAHVRGVGNTTGNAIVEVYEVP